MRKVGKMISAIKKTAAIIAAFIIAFAGLSDGYALTANASLKDLEKAACCVFIIPEGFYPCDTPGLYVNEHYPLESANIMYSVTDIPKDKILTNAQKAAGEDPSGTEEEILYDELTKEMYEEIQTENYTELYGDNIGYNVSEFTQMLFDEYPGYKISASFTPEGSQTIYQDIVLILSFNKIFTIVYSRAEADDFEEVFKESMDTIHVLL